MTDDPLDAMKARWSGIRALFAWMREDNDPITEALGRLITTLDVIGLEAFVPDPPRGPGRPPEDRRALARAFVAKAVLGIPTTSADRTPRRRQVPASHSRLGAPLASLLRGHLFPGVRRIRARSVAGRIDAALIGRAFGGRIVGAIARDATEIEAREKPVQNKPNGGKRRRPPPREPIAAAQARTPAQGRARPKPEPTRIERQVTQTLEPDARRPAHRRDVRLQEKQQGLQGDLDRVQARHRRGQPASFGPAC